jgi:hypothetical protein
MACVPAIYKSGGNRGENEEALLLLEDSCIKQQRWTVSGANMQVRQMYSRAKRIDTPLTDNHDPAHGTTLAQLVRDSLVYLIARRNFST